MGNGAGLYADMALYVLKLVVALMWGLGTGNNVVHFYINLIVK